MKIVILRRYFLLNLFFCIAMLICFFASFINFFDDNIKLLPSIAGTVGFFSLSLFWIWIILRNYLQVFWFKKDGIYSNKGFKKYLHFAFKNVKTIKIVTFDCPPKFERGSKIRGVDSILSAPKKSPKKWIVITDGRENDNLCNYNSYLVPIRSHMVIKIEHSEEKEKMLSNCLKCNIEYCKISLDEMAKHTPITKDGSNAYI